MSSFVSSVPSLSKKICLFFHFFPLPITRNSSRYVPSFRKLHPLPNSFISPFLFIKISLLHPFLSHFAFFLSVLFFCFSSFIILFLISFLSVVFACHSFLTQPSPPSLHHFSTVNLISSISCLPFSLPRLPPFPFLCSPHPLLLLLLSPGSSPPFLPSDFLHHPHHLPSLVFFILLYFPSRPPFLLCPPTHPSITLRFSPTTLASLPPSLPQRSVRVLPVPALHPLMYPPIKTGIHTLIL